MTSWRLQSKSQSLWCHALLIPNSSNWIYLFV